MDHCHCCPDCSSGKDGSASSETGTRGMPSGPTATGAAPDVDTASRSGGMKPQYVMSPYADILGDLLMMLHDAAEGYVDETPFLKLAKQAIEYELADRLMDLPIVDPRSSVN